MLKERYHSEVIPKLMQELGYKSIMQVPRIEKVALNMGIKEAHDDPKVLESCMKDLAKIVGQRPVVTKAKRSISDFGVTQGDAVGCKVTLRGLRAYVFLEKLFNVVLPSVRDFRGLSADAFDGRGNYSMGLDEQLVFPEIHYDDIVKVQGMNITIATTARTDREAYYLLKELGCPLQD
ncbi:MAG: 50S ribosomal protein L5 [Candidatus Fraserbacteria bacterium RBG_16_55_9]|uniref:Large ribosomal subunit protein uL5 n=1 Tax=Fraserbacteria sp. (strain RBG_16_55_9) TaxID=1817864 RepID=A0A1F5UPC0_FRAXR|nr:ribosomal protein L5 [uncultured bacterium]OGF53003.1 MAG: 50S ribosomal protein L5 [Candidatus Fraserbacteria bacterium RBG_16_55_9]